jgi:hypothetical protein
MDNQLATALEKFVAERWTYATTLVSHTTSADQALKSMGIGGGGGGGQQGVPGLVRLRTVIKIIRRIGGKRREKMATVVQAKCQ